MTTKPHAFSGTPDITGLSSDDRTKSPEQLLCEFRDGDSRAFDVIAHKYMGLVAKYARAFDTDGRKFDDLCQEGLIALYRAVCGYRIGSEAFSAYASKSIRNSMISYMRSDARKTVGEVSIDDIPETYLVESADSVSPEDIVISEQFGAQLKKRAMEELSDYERCVFLLYLEGMTATQTAECLGKSKKSVGNALSRIKSKLASGMAGFDTV